MECDKHLPGCPKFGSACLSGIKENNGSGLYASNMSLHLVFMDKRSLD